MNHSMPQTEPALRSAYHEYVGKYGASRALTAMATDWGCTTNTVRRHLAAAKIRSLRVMPERPDADHLRQRHDAVVAEHGERAAAGKLAAEFGVTHVTARQWLIDYGIRVPKPREAPPREPIITPCPCGAVAVARYKGCEDPLCFKCYMRIRSADQTARAAKEGRVIVRTSRNHAIEAKKGKPCTDCGGYFPTCCIEWDHVPERGPKLFNLGRADYAMEKVLAEIAKCDLVCANCHAIRTWNRKHPEAPVSLEPVSGDSAYAVTAETTLP